MYAKKVSGKYLEATFLVRSQVSLLDLVAGKTMSAVTINFWEQVVFKRE